MFLILWRVLYCFFVTQDEDEYGTEDDHKRSRSRLRSRSRSRLMFPDGRHGRKASDGSGGGYDQASDACCRPKRRKKSCPPKRRKKRSCPSSGKKRKRKAIRFSYRTQKKSLKFCEP